jgi:hypothetical protein
MKAFTRHIALAAVAAVALGLPLAAAAAPSGPQGRTWAEIAKLPDWGGVWDTDWSKLFGPGGRTQPDLTPAYKAQYDAWKAAQKEGENLQTTTANCLPPGIPQIMQQPYPMEFLFTPGKVTIAIEAYNQMRRVFTDGRPHPKDPDPLWYGHSIGHWDNGDLIIDTVGFDTATEIAPGVHHSDKMHTVERVHLLDPNRMEITTTITDPEALAKPYVVKMQYVRHRDWDIKEYICEQNNHDHSDAEGRPSMKLN